MAGLNDDGATASLKSSVDEQGAPVVNITGELDISTVPGIEAQLQTVVATAPALLVFDLSALDFMDSSGIALLLRAKRFRRGAPHHHGNGFVPRVAARGTTTGA